MSTTFDVIPMSPKLPLFAEVCSLASTYLARYLGRSGLDGRPIIKATLRKQKPDVQLPLDTLAQTRWDSDQYAWFFIDGLTGGADAYFKAMDVEIKECFREEVESNPRYGLRRETISRCLENDHYWYFRRGGAQPALILAAYGMVAASFAELTCGLITSNDNAWDYERFPATAEEFLSFYFRPESALSESMREWSERCIKLMSAELKDLSQS